MSSNSQKAQRAAELVLIAYAAYSTWKNSRSTQLLVEATTAAKNEAKQNEAKTSEASASSQKKKSPPSSSSSSSANRSSPLFSPRQQQSRQSPHFQLQQAAQQTVVPSQPSLSAPNFSIAGLADPRTLLSIALLCLVAISAIPLQLPILWLVLGFCLGSVLTQASMRPSQYPSHSVHVKVPVTSHTPSSIHIQQPLISSQPLQPCTATLPEIG